MGRKIYRIPDRLGVRQKLWCVRPATISGQIRYLGVLIDCIGFWDQKYL